MKILVWLSTSAGVFFFWLSRAFSIYNLLKNNTCIYIVHVLFRHISTGIMFDILWRYCYFKL